jgi:murein DD-endopeptidase MepM/ murein hydrolase activator NlpD
VSQTRHELRNRLSKNEKTRHLTVDAPHHGIYLTATLVASVFFGVRNLNTADPTGVAPLAPTDHRLGRRRWFLAVAALPLFTGAMAYQVSRNPANEVPRSIDLTELAAIAEPAITQQTQQPQPDRVELTVQRNDTLDALFRKAGLDRATLAELRQRSEVRKALDVLKPGDVISITHLDGLLLSLTRQISDTQTLSIARTDGQYAVDYIENPLEHQIVGHRARIETSLFDAGKAEGISAPVILSMANDMFGWDIDFALEIRQGDEFGVLYEQNFQDGRYLGDGRVLAAEFVNSGKRHSAVWFESTDGKVKGYFSPQGQGMRKAFLRAPVDFTRISSKFNPKRLHPISGKVRAHKGIDYAAPTGTPIRAAGGGTVEFSGRQGGYGNCVVLNHGNGITTLYGHMSRLAAKRGQRVSQGQLIGYVGSTGASTGPHLHYEYRVRGVHKNPATVTMPRTELPAQYKAEFDRQAGVALAKLAVVARPLTDTPPAAYAAN